MRSASLVTVAIAVAVSATPAPGEFRQVRSERDYMERVAGRTVVTAGAALRIGRDWTFAGTLADGTPVTGAWTWSGPWYCFNMVKDGDRSRTYCHEIWVDGSRMIVVPERGRGTPERATLR